MAAQSKHTFEEDVAKLVATVGDLFNPDPTPKEPQNAPDSEQSKPVPTIYVPTFGVRHDMSTPAAAVQFGRFMTPIAESAIISESATFAAAVEQFLESNHSVLLVSNGKGLVGAVDFRDIFKSEGRICFFALTMELERAALEYCQHWLLECYERDFFRDQLENYLFMKGRLESPADQAQRILLDPDARKGKRADKCRARKALQLYEEKFPGRVRKLLNGSQESKEAIEDGRAAFELLACIQFCDKRTILEQLAERELIAGWDPKKIKELMKDAETLRNHCAHPSGLEGSKFEEDEPEFELVQFRNVFRDCQNLIRTLREHTPEWTPRWITRLY